MRFGDWAITEDLAARIVARLNELNPKAILECGSGTSTRVMGEWAADMGATLTTLEHNEKYFKETKALCAHLSSVNLLLAPIKDGFYSASLPSEIDFALIDGPPGNIGRERTLPNIWPNLSEGAEVWLDDANRDHEKACVAAWKKSFSIDVQIDTVAKGLAIITKKKN